MSRFLPRLAARLAAVAAVSSAGVGLYNAFGSSSAHADPAFTSSFAGVGSDTTQDLFDAFSGADPYPPSGSTILYTPLSSGGTTNQTVSSFDAIPAGGSASAPGCITTKLGGPSFDRPNGSGAGTTALADAVGGILWQASTASCTGTGVSVTGQIDFARTIKGPKTSGSNLTWIPYGRDAVAVAYWDHSTGHLAALTTAELTALYSSSTGTATINGDTVEACLPVSTAAVRTNFETAIGVTDSVANAAAQAANCNNLEQNGGNTFYSTVSGLAAGTDAVIPFSSASWISQANQVALDRSNTARANGVNLASVDGLGVPYTGTAPNERPNTTVYQSTQYGVTAYTIVATNKITGFGASAGLKGLFVGSTSAVCSTTAQTLLNTFGFDSLTAAEGTCGSTTLTGNG